MVGSGQQDTGRLGEYRRRRESTATPEPFGAKNRAERGGPVFVVHEHHARRLHWDLRLERNGVLVSWAVPKGLPQTPDTNHLAVHVEDHPLEYGGFEGEIPAGQYGAGQVLIFDRGGYDTEKWTDHEIKVVLHGERLRGRYVLFATGGDNWMVHRMDPPTDPDWQPPPDWLRPMRATPGELPAPDQDPRWGFEFGFDGRRVLVRVADGQVRVASARGEDLTARYPELRGLGRALGATPVLLDGEVVAFGEDGRPSRSRLRQRSSPPGAPSGGGPGGALVRDLPVTYLCYDLLHAEGHPLLDQPYRRRRQALDRLGLSGTAWQVPPWWAGGGPEVLRAATEQGLPAILAKRLDSTYQPGARSGDWVAIPAG